MTTAWPPDRIQRLRQALEEDTATFGAHVGRSGRTIEDWEQGRRHPDTLACREMTRINARLAKRHASP